MLILTEIVMWIILPFSIQTIVVNHEHQLLCIDFIYFWNSIKFFNDINRRTRYSSNHETLNGLSTILFIFILTTSSKVFTESNHYTSWSTPFIMILYLTKSIIFFVIFKMITNTLSSIEIICQSSWTLLRYF